MEIIKRGKPNWVMTPNGNWILQGRGFYISYNKSPFLGSGEETALLIEEDGVWRILDGDFREEYEKEFWKGAKACLKVYERNIKDRSEWSTDD